MRFASCHLLAREEFATGSNAGQTANTNQLARASRTEHLPHKTNSILSQTIRKLVINW